MNLHYPEVRFVNKDGIGFFAPNPKGTGKKTCASEQFKLKKNGNTEVEEICDSKYHELLSAVKLADVLFFTRTDDDGKPINGSVKVFTDSLLARIMDTSYLYGRGNPNSKDITLEAINEDWRIVQDGN